MAGKKRAKLNREQKSERIKTDLQHKRDRERVWEVIKSRSYIKAKYVSQKLPITSQKAARLLKKIEGLGYIEVFKQRKAGKVWRNLKVEEG